MMVNEIHIEKTSSGWILTDEGGERHVYQDWWDLLAHVGEIYGEPVFSGNGPVYLPPGSKIQVPTPCGRNNDV